MSCSNRQCNSLSWAKSRPHNKQGWFTSRAVLNFLHTAWPSRLKWNQWFFFIIFRFKKARVLGTHWMCSGWAVFTGTKMSMSGRVMDVKLRTRVQMKCFFAGMQCEHTKGFLPSISSRVLQSVRFTVFERQRPLPYYIHLKRPVRFFTSQFVLILWDVFSFSCNHLTAFSGAFVYPPNSLTVKDLTDAEK